MNTYEANFNKNLGALESYNAILADKIEDVKTNERFEVFTGKSAFDINIYDHELKQSLYDNPEKFFDEKYNEIYTKYERYPVLFFYGLGNGLLYKALLKNENHKSIVVFEPNIEILYIVFHLIDFSQELKDKRLYVVDTNDFDMDDIINFLMGELFVRNYLYDSKILSLNSYYNQNKTHIEKLEKKLNEKIMYVFNAQGSNRITTLSQDLKFSIKNTPKMLTKVSFKDFINQRKEKNKTAIIVASGPSLIKQLPLLKESANKATIICVDGSYPILVKYNIKPDIVISLDSSELNSKFFDNNHEEFDKNITFIVTASTHSDTIKYLEKNHRNYLLVLRPSSKFTHKMLINDFGTLGGLNVAYMGYELAVKLEHKNIILIGQDLAFDEKGNSHPMEFLYGENFDNNVPSLEKRITTTAYGGKGEVITHQGWKYYIQSYELYIKETTKKSIITYNATEGGARIEGAIEKSFKQVCDELLKEDKIIFPFLNSLPKKEQILLAKQSYDYFLELIKFAKSKIYQCQKLLKPILKVIEQTRYHIDLNTINFVKILKTNDEIHKVKEFLEDEKMSIFSDQLVAALTLTELELAKISLMSAHTQEDKKIRMIIWLIKHEKWLKLVIDTLESQIKIMEQSIQDLKDFIKVNNEYLRN
ncbi:motility associated factor glycosyltransferase family protein [Campylobacter lari]|uniref:motility associated factor glycosyltransferase family protein n=1 Tax=Campylobacter lari TaxID=201 RepID=UPI00057E877A|nr:motility accessory factor [Campylobacter lari]AJD05719.1 motility accessory factor [Campylobacter lari RM16712]